MPRIPSDTRSGILESFELETIVCESYGATKFKEPFPISGDQVCHWPTLPSVAMKPESAVHGEDHPVATTCKFAVARGTGSSHTRVPQFSVLRRLTDRPSGLLRLRGQAVALTRRTPRTR